MRVIAFDPLPPSYATLSLSSWLGRQIWALQVWWGRLHFVKRSADEAG